MSSEYFLRFGYPGQSNVDIPKALREEYDRTWGCPKCHTPRIGAGAIDIRVAHGSPLQWPLNLATACWMPIARRDFLEQFGWDRVMRDLHIGRVLYDKGRPIEHLVTFRGRYILFVRGTKMAKCRVCNSCGRHFYSSVDESYLYPDPPHDAELFQCDTGDLVVRESVGVPIAAKRWPHVKVDRLPVFEQPLDGLPALPFDN